MRIIDAKPRTNPNCTARYHGTKSAYHQSCRCPEATEDRRLRDKQHREGRAEPRMISAVGTRRRLQALSVIGWRYADIAAHLGVSLQAAQLLAAAPSPMVHVTTARRVAAVYRDLSQRRGPSKLAAERAVARGWVGPMDWPAIDDPTCPHEGCNPIPNQTFVRAALAGHAPLIGLSAVDRREVWRQWSQHRTGDGVGIRDFARTFNVPVYVVRDIRRGAEGLKRIRKPASAATCGRTEERLAA